MSARNALIASFGSTLVATAILVAGFVRNDYSLVYVAEHSSRSLGGIYKVSALWGGQEGSLLLWLLILTGYSALAVWVNRNRTRDLVVWVTPVLAGIAVGFSFLLVAVATPFATQVAPIDGSGLNPSLQNPYMMSHPPFLYLGYVGLAVPFAFAMGALLSGRTDERWIVATRRWTLIAWTALGIGQLLGSHWAYVEVGWGGFYAWDPVENAALMPFLAATAFLHSVMIQEKRGMLKVWNIVLVSLAFCLSIFGTFLTRSGVVNSIHSFSQSSIGAWFLAFIVIAVVFSTVMIIWRLPLLRSTTRLESLVSREAVFLYNNLLLVALCLTILWGVAWPILSEAVRGDSVVVGRPYFDFFLRIFGLPLLLLMGVGPLIAWRRASLRGARPDVLLARSRRRRHRCRAADPGGRLVDPGSDRVHVLGIRPRRDRARVRARHPGPPCALARVVARGVRLARRSKPPPLRRLHRPRRDRPLRDRRRRGERVRLRRRGAPGKGRGAHGVRVHGALSGAQRATDRSRNRGAGQACSSARTARISAASRRARTRTRSPAPSRRSRRRSGSAPTTSRARTSS